MRPETQNSSSAKDSKTNPLSSISAIEKSLKSQDLGQDNPLSEISEGWSAVILKPEESQFTELLNRTFAVTAALMDSKLDASSKESLQHIRQNGVFYEYVHKTVTEQCNDTDQMQKIRQLMKDYLTYIHNLHSLPKDQIYDSLMRYPDPNPEFYLCVDGAQARLFNVAASLKLSGVDFLIYQIHHQICNDRLPGLSKHVISENQAHIPFALLNIIGVNQDDVVRADQFHLNPLSGIAASDALDFFIEYQDSFNAQVEFLINAIENNKSDKAESAYALSSILKSYSINIDPSEGNGDAWYAYQTEEGGSDDEEEKIIWNNKRREFLEGLRSLQINTTFSPLKEYAQKLHQNDASLPEDIKKLINSEELTQQIAAINLLYFLAEDFVGRSVYQLLGTLGADEREILQKLQEGSDLDNATKQKLDKVLDTAIYKIQNESDDSVSKILSQNAPSGTTMELLELAKLNNLPVGTDYENAAKALAASPHRKQILQELLKFPIDNAYYYLYSEMWQYATKCHYTDFVRDLADLFKEQSDEVKKQVFRMLNEESDYNCAIINIVIKCQDNFKDIIPFLQMADDSWFHGAICQNMIHYCCQNNQGEFLTAILDAYQKINPHRLQEYLNTFLKNDVTESTPLHLAALNGHLGVVRVLIGWGANVDAQDEGNYTPLHLAALNGHSKVVQALIEGGANVDAQDEHKRTPLYLASLNGHLGVVLALIEKKANINTQNQNNHTPIHMAVISVNLGVVQALIKGGAKINVRDKDKYTPLHMAALNGHLEVVQELIGGGAEINVRDKNNMTPLHMAAHDGHLEVVQELIGGGAEINVRDKDNYTPLHMAAQKGRLEVVDKLLESGAKIEIIDGDSPFEEGIKSKIKKYNEHKIFSPDQLLEVLTLINQDQDKNFHQEHSLDDKDPDFKLNAYGIVNKFFPKEKNIESYEGIKHNTELLEGLNTLFSLVKADKESHIKTPNQATQPIKIVTELDFKLGSWR